MTVGHTRAVCAGLFLFSFGAVAQQYGPWPAPPDLLQKMVGGSEVKNSLASGSLLLQPQAFPSNPFIPFWEYATQAIQNLDPDNDADGTDNGDLDDAYAGLIVGASPSFPYGPLNVSVPIIPIVIQQDYPQTYQGLGATTIILDPTAPDPGCLTNTNGGGNTAKSLTTASPMFSATSFNINGQFIGATTYGDAILRAEFWNYPGFNGTFQRRLNLSPAQFPPLVLDIPQTSLANENISTGFYFGNPAAGCGGAATPLTGKVVNPADQYFVIDVDYLDAQMQQYILNHGILPSQFPLFILYRTLISIGPVFGSEGIALGYHNWFGNLQTYGVADFEVNAFFAGSGKDVSVVSHEVNEWINDPFGINATPPWGNIGQVGGCQGNFEVGDPLTGTFMPPITQNGYTFHLQEIAFFNWFFGGTTNYGAGGKYSSNGTFTGYAKPCPPGGTF